MKDGKGMPDRELFSAGPDAELPAAGQFYRHFKGGLYQIIGIACDADDGRELVVYQALYGDYRWYVREAAEFMSAVDGEKYPLSAGKRRFERVQPQDSGGGTRTEAEKWNRPEKDERAFRRAENAHNPSTAGPDKTKAAETPDGRAAAQKEDKEQTEGRIRPELLRFLDAESAAEKLQVLRQIRGKMDEALLTSLELSLDLMPDARESEERRLELVERNLEKRARFEGGRLR